MPNLRLISVAAAGGIAVNVAATRWCRRVEAIEDEGNGNAPQGFSCQTILDGFVNSRGVGPGTQPLIIQNSMSQGRGQGPIIGIPPGASQMQVSNNVLQGLISLGAATVVAVTEFD
jgi:hypothetical protein